MAPLAMGLTGVEGTGSIATKRVDLSSYSFKVAGVATTPVLTETVNLESVWDWANEGPVREPMG